MSRKTKPRVPLTDRDPTVGAIIYAIRVGVWASSDFDQFMERFGITLLQFNVLRTLYNRDPDREGIPTGSLIPHLLTRMPDLPRLVDRLVKAELVERLPSETDRRVVLVRLTHKGLDMIDRTTQPVTEHCRERLAHMTAAEIAQLHQLLRKAYDGLPR